MASRLKNSHLQPLGLANNKIDVGGMFACSLACKGGIVGIKSMGSKPGEEGYDCTESAVVFSITLPIFGINQLIRPDDHSCASNYNESIKHQILKYCQ